MVNPLLPAFLTWARKLRYPTLFKITGLLFLLTVFIPDPFPLADEILLGLGTMLLANWKGRKNNDRIIEPDPSAGRKP